MQLPAQSQSFPRTTSRRHSRATYRAFRRFPDRLKSLLRPIWTAMDRTAHPDAEQPGGSFTEVSPDSPILPMTRAELNALAARDPYYRGRQTYLGGAAWAAAELIDR